MHVRLAPIRSGIGENMEDRYLFKAKRVYNGGKWVQGYYVKGLDMYGKEVHLIFEPNTMFYSSGETGGWYKVDPTTICRCTGLRSKNGKLIWEKDIIRCKLGKVIVLWDEAQWKVKKCDEVFIRYKDLYFWVSDRNAEVIGNIFDNKELLESEG